MTFVIMLIKRVLSNVPRIPFPAWYSIYLRNKLFYSMPLNIRFFYAFSRYSPFDVPVNTPPNHAHFQTNRVHCYADCPRSINDSASTPDNVFTKYTVCTYRRKLETAISHLNRSLWQPRYNVYMSLWQPRYRVYMSL